MKQIKKLSGRFHQIAQRTEIGIARHIAKADQIFVRLGGCGGQPKRLGGRIMAFHLAGRFNLAACLEIKRQIDRAGAQQPQCVPVHRDDRRFQPDGGRPGIEDQRNTAR